MRSLNGVDVDVNLDYLNSKYPHLVGDSLEDILTNNFNEYAFNYENIERELKAILGRYPTEDEINSCLGI